MKKIETYKGVDIFYNTQNGKLQFKFEGEREVRYLFEAQQIIDEPVWEDCDLQGFYLDHSLWYEIGLAKATRRNIKDGKPDWQYKGKYDTQYKTPNYGDGATVYPLTEETKKIYIDWKEQNDIVYEERTKANKIAERIKLTKGDN